MERRTQNTEHKAWNTEQDRARSARSCSVPCSVICVPYSAGFSLVETIVAIAILTVAMAAPLSLAERGLRASAYAKDQVTASYLAEEAIEYARNVRDGNSLSGRGGALWLRGLALCLSPLSCGVDVTASGNSQVTACSPLAPEACRLTFNPETGVYGQRREGNGNPLPGWQNTVFTRTLQIMPVTVSGDANGEADLTAVVSWNTGIISKSITVNEKIFNWYR